MINKFILHQSYTINYEWFEDQCNNSIYRNKLKDIIELNIVNRINPDENSYINIYGDQVEVEDSSIILARIYFIVDSILDFYLDK